ncbi:MAG: hypothetical protein OK438_06905 [Thaumarchaeota archaeon]|nr:hypothetical protein [Nitrososphaerota archaeon]
MAWCKVSSLTAAVSRTLRHARFPISRSDLLTVTSGKTVEGWEVSYFLGQALHKGRYPDLRSVMADLESWVESQG